MEVAVINIDGKETGRKVNLNETIFGIEPNDHAIYLDTKQYMAGQRQGTHKTRERAEVMGSTRKLKRQKGTGTARFGSIKNPQFRGGGRVFGPRPRYYGFKLNKKVKELARKSALTYKARENKIIILEDFSFDVPKTSKMAGISANLSLPNKKSVIVLPEQNNNIYLSSRNLQGVEVITVSDLNTYTIMKASTLVLTESVVDVLQSTL
ncbi:MAG TPA: 50S ribosomal protein L4 [Bacteroidales bacterium]|jgi:large subunit ribosomal protein L4|nr:50S ribosomal protein L4 [Bacteroidales bacterium]HHU99744.1 50S ribosomal protein L4 [Bacteroidales bacterium]HOR08468.1 50S ribosomal protein L4 [Bacteroidales bacterium]HQI10882.1 50S ribosomal protein L4 [Bacteroidales bacterium]